MGVGRRSSRMHSCRPPALLGHLSLFAPQAVDRLASLRVWRDEKSFESFVTSQQSPQPSEF